MINFLIPKEALPTTRLSVDTSKVKNIVDFDDNASLGFLLRELELDFCIHYHPKSKNINYYFPICLGSSSWNFLLSFKYWDLIRDNDNVQLLMYYGFESIQWKYYNQCHWFEELEKHLTNNKIPPNKVKFIVGDLNCKENTKTLSNYMAKVSFLGINIFELVHHTRHTVTDSYQQENKKEFLCLNSFMRWQRQALVFYLEKNNLLKNSLTSCIHWDYCVITEDEFESIKIDDTIYDEILEYRESVKPKRLTMKDINGDNIRSDESRSYLDFCSETNLYDSTKYSLVSETYCSQEGGLFITEKSYKPISMGHPFIIFGPTGILKQLREDGYETFPELFDESYDDHVKPADQLKIIIKNLKTPKTITPEIIRKCERNRNHFYKQKGILKNKNKLKEFLSDT